MICLIKTEQISFNLLEFKLKTVKTVIFNFETCDSGKL